MARAMIKFSIIIPVTEKDTDFLKRCLHSLLDQDYKNYEIIVVGHDNLKAKSIASIASIEIRYLNIESDTAPAKRNAGFDLSSGDVVLFFDCDCYLLPGMLRLFKDTFEDNDDIGFIYGAYRWNVESLNTFPSRPFDPYLLETTNYISTMSPMKREIFPRFREDLEFFQDWDLFLRITQKGHKGYFIQDALFMTEPTDGLSISGNQKHTYLHKVKHIRELNGIKSKPICVTTLGAPHQSIQRAKVLGADYFGAHAGSSLIQTPSMFDHRYKMIYVMGFYPTALQDHANLFANAPQDCLKVVQWIGTDVYQLHTRFNWATLKFMRDSIFSHIDVSLCNSKGLQDELSEVGVKAEVLPMPLLDDIKVSPLPEKFTVGVYYSDSNPMYNLELMMDIAKSTPDINFKFFGGSMHTNEDNIEYLGWAPIQKIIDKCSMNLRICIHDGFPHTPIHFMLGGRQVLTNFEMEGANYIDIKVGEENLGECKVKIIEKIRAIKAGKEKKDLDKAKDYYLKLMDKDEYKRKIYEILKNGNGVTISDPVAAKCV